jgi:tRNA A37 threonylcarbamoyladenosine modification protein TsaB
VIVAFSTSCRIASVALLTMGRELLWAGEREAPQAASGTCLSLLEEGLSLTGIKLDSALLFAADLGPGSFTGVRVGVTLAKTFAYLRAVRCYGATAFDLIDPDRTVVLPSKRGEWFVREMGREPYRVTDLSAAAGVGYGQGIEDPRYPLAAGFARLPVGEIDAERLVPAYLVPPSISSPKKPYGGEVAR